MSVNFQDLLKRPVDSAKRPEAKPAGTYLGTIKEYKFDESSKQKTPFVRIIVNNVSPGADVDATLLEGVDLSKWNPGKDYYLTEDALYRLKELLVSCKIPTEGRGFDETIPELRGQPVQFVVTQRPYEDKSSGEMLLANDIGLMTGA